MNVIQNQSNSVKSQSAKTLNCVLAIGAGSFLTSDKLVPYEDFQDEPILEKVTTLFNALPARYTTYVKKPVLRPLPLSAIVFGGVTVTCAILLMSATKGNSDTSAASNVSVDTPKEARSTSSIVTHKDTDRPHTPVIEHSEKAPFAEPVEEEVVEENQEEVVEENQEEVVEEN
eukprot:303838_1